MSQRYDNNDDDEFNDNDIMVLMLKLSQFTPSTSQIVYAGAVDGEFYHDYDDPES